MADTLTDTDLRKRLTALGHDVGPLNATTRPLWMKKLKYKAEPKKSTKSQMRSTAASRKVPLGFSSDESEDESRPSTSTNVHRLRSTSRMSKSTTRARTSEIFAQPEEVATRPTLRRRSTSSSVAGNRVNASRSSARGYGSSTVFNSTFTLDESDIDIADSPRQNLVSISTNTSPTIERTLDSPAAVTPSDLHGEPVSKPLSTSTPEKSVPKTRSMKESNHTAPKYSRSIDRSDLFLPGSSKSNHLPVNGNKNANKRQKLDSSFDDSLSDEEEIKQQGFKTTESATYSWTQYISIILLLGLTCFFLLLGATYINLRGEAERSYNVQKDNLMLCETGALSGSKKTVGPCFTSGDVSKALAALKPLYNILSTNAGQHDCGYAAKYKDRHLTLLEVMNAAKGVNLTVMFHLIMKNEHWGIRLLSEDSSVLTLDPTKVWYIESTTPYYPLLCRTKRFLKQMLNWIIGLILAAILAFVAWILYRYDQRKKYEERALVYNMVENIIETLKAHYDSSIDDKDIQPYMAIPHVRDMLIAPHERSSKQSIWDQAVKFLAANESRIRVETQVISGEEFPVWRWLHGYAANTSKGKKMWQGQAFGEYPSNRGSTLPFSPTPCLKIRNMFDPNIEVGEWEVGVCDVILEKCQDINDIVHISVDKTSTEGCVYLKCGTPAGAGKVYRSLHGWWFDGNLVTVKFLRLERYHERFPDSVKCKIPLKPTSAQSSWFSSL